MASKLSALIAATTEKTTPVDADKVPILDSAATNYFKWISWGSLKAAIASIFTKTTEQLRLGYDASNYTAYTVSSAGRLAEGVTSAGGSTTFYRSTDGAFWSETSGQMAGNARGAGAVDLQSYRTSATRVANGAQSIAIGVNNTASGAQSVSFGSSNTASGTQAVALGSSNTSNGNNSLSVGLSCNAAGLASIAIGNYASNAIIASEALGGGVASGQHQMGRIPLGIATTDATPTVLNLRATEASRPTISAKAAWFFKCHVIAHTSTTTYRVAAWEITGVIARDGSNNTRIVGTPTITEIVNESTWIGTAPTVTADDTNEALAITVTGVAATTIRWTCGVYYTQTLAS